MGGSWLGECALQLLHFCFLFSMSMFANHVAKFSLPNKKSVTLKLNLVVPEKARLCSIEIAEGH